MAFSIAHFRHEFNLHNADFLKGELVFAELFQGVLHRVRLRAPEIVENLLLMVRVDVEFDVLVDIQAGT